MNMNWCVRTFLKRCVKGKVECTGNVFLRKYSVDSQEAYHAFPERKVATTVQEQLDLLQQRPIMPRHPRLSRVAVIGSPNAGKSTLINQILNWKICSVSPKVHTTRKNIRAVHVDGDTQLLLLDTPGLVTNKHAKRHQLDERLVTDPGAAILQADVIAVVHDVSNKPHRYVIDHKVVKLLAQHAHRKHILVINKVDRLKDKKKLLRVTNHLCNNTIDGAPISVESDFPKHDKQVPESSYDAVTKWRNCISEGDKIDDDSIKEFLKLHEGWPGFKRVFMLSALSGDGVRELKNYLIDEAEPGAWLYHPSVVTDQRPDEIALMTIKEKLLHVLPQEVPHKLQLEIEFWNIDDLGCLDVIFRILYSQKNLGGLLVGPRGNTINNIAREAEQELRNTFRCEVRLKIGVYHKSKINTNAPMKLGNW